MNKTKICPYSVNGICYHKSCIHLPHLDCMKKSEFDNRMKYVKHKKVVKRK